MWPGLGYLEKFSWGRGVPPTHISAHLNFKVKFLRAEKGEGGAPRPPEKCSKQPGLCHIWDYSSPLFKNSGTRPKHTPDSSLTLLKITIGFSLIGCQHL